LRATLAGGIHAQGQGDSVRPIFQLRSGHKQEGTFSFISPPSPLPHTHKPLHRRSNLSKDTLYHSSGHTQLSLLASLLQHTNPTLHRSRSHAISTLATGYRSISSPLKHVPFPGDVDHITHHCPTIRSGDPNPSVEMGSTAGTHHAFSLCA
jgi:hypothetical protein